MEKLTRFGLSVENRLSLSDDSFSIDFMGFSVDEVSFDLIEFVKLSDSLIYFSVSEGSEQLLCIVRKNLF